MAGFNTVYGFYGGHLKNGLSCWYKTPFDLKDQFFARREGKGFLNRFNAFGRAEEGYECDYSGYKNQLKPRSAVWGI
jgi:hypothetical protein